ncbi:MAG TPA: quinone oxidoreductase [Anaeromyxobacteraceae bacterium]|nr:quinone oxidoreductase [Anaeromyxobacteraceae bacterium]
MIKAIRIHETGGPEVLRVEALELPPPGPGEVRVRHEAVGVNFVDTYHRTGLYPLPLPTGLGVEAAGVVEAVGAGVAGLRAGDRVATIAPPGSYAEARNVLADRAVPLPAGVGAEQAAAGFVKGLTAHMLMTRYRAVRAGDPVVVTAAAGGVGQLLVQWLKAIGATVIAVVGSDAKAATVRALGADLALVSGRDDVPARVKALTGGVPIVYDSVGKATFETSLDCLAPFGVLVVYGNASGPVPPIDPGLLARKGSLAVARPSVFNHVARRADLEAASAAFFAALAEGRVKVAVGGRWPLVEAAEAHRALESRATSGSLLLLP